MRNLTHINNIKPNAISLNIYSGESLFFTLVTEQRRKLFIDEKNVELLYQAFRHVMKKRPFAIDAIVVLPEHLHCIWTLPPNDADFSIRWRLIKTGFTKHCDNEYKVTPNLSRIKKMNEQYGNFAIGNIYYVMNWILNTISTISIINPSNMITLTNHQIGNIRVFIVI